MDTGRSLSTSFHGHVSASLFSALVVQKYFQRQRHSDKVGLFEAVPWARRGVCLRLSPWQWVSSLCFFPPKYFGHWSLFVFFFLSKKQSKRTTITSLCSMLFVVNLTGMFQAPLHARHFFQNGTICPCLQCLSSIAGETVNIISTWGQKQCEKYHGDSGEGAIGKKLHQRADLRKGRGRDYKGDLPILHSSSHWFTKQVLPACDLPGARGLGVKDE